MCGNGLCCMRRWRLHLLSGHDSVKQEVPHLAGSSTAHIADVGCATAHAARPTCQRTWAVQHISDQCLAVQVEWGSASGGGTDVPICSSEIGVAAPVNTNCKVTGTVRVVPMQFHFHTPSEHADNGVYVRFPTTFRICS